MSKIGIFMADGCEEIEGLTVVDIAVSYTHLTLPTTE